IWSIAAPHKRIWPPPGKRTWQYRVTWIGFYLVFGINALFILFDWNTWIFNGPLRFVPGIPLIIIGTLLFSWGIRTLGTINTSGVSDRFIKTGPYQFTRNPQYLGDMILFIGLSIVTNSLYLWITHILLILVFVVTPLAEEKWLEEQYGELYLQYKNQIARFL
ncbi:phosphatidylethanolamine N-methyltransferase family protein, partial [bacterium]|nr:phosphatidylethanolamine N-methyltransferase family protein [bacterium]